jgi:hypothetical protein
MWLWLWLACEPGDGSTEDAPAASSCRYGLECLFRFYSFGLEAPGGWDAALYADFEAAVAADAAAFLPAAPGSGGDARPAPTVAALYGLEKLWAFHHYTGLPAGCGVTVHAEVREGFFCFSEGFFFLWRLPPPPQAPPLPPPRCPTHPPP